MPLAWIPCPEWRPRSAPAILNSRPHSPAVTISFWLARRKKVELMKQYAGRFNRTWLAIVGLVLVLGGVYTILLGTAVAPGPATSDPLVNSDVSSAFDQPWAAIIIAAVGVVIALFALWWLVKQIPRTNPGRPFRLQDDAARGLTVCKPSVLSEAVQDDLTALAGVRSADAVLRGTSKDPELTVRVGVDDRADVQALLHDIHTDVAPRLAAALDAPVKHLAVRVDIERGKRKTDSVAV